MADQETRNRILWEFLQTGSPQQIEDAVNRLATAATKLEQATGHLNKTQQAHDAQAPQHQAHIEKTKSSLMAASDAAYKFGMGAQWSGIQQLGFVSQAGNTVNGLGMMVEGFQGLTGAVGAGALAIGGIAIGIAAVGVVIKETTSRTLELTSAIQKLSETTTLSLGEAGRRFSAFSAAFGGAAAGGILSGIAGSQASLSPVAMFQQLNAMRTAGAPGQFFNPFLQGPAQFGLSTVQPGSTVQHPIFQDPAEVFKNVARDIAARQDPNQKMLEMNRLGPMFGDKGQESLGMLVREIERGQQNGEHPDAVIQRVLGKGSLGFNPNAADSMNTDRFKMAVNEMETAWGRLEADIGSVILPKLTWFFNTLSGILEFFGGGADKMTGHGSSGGGSPGGSSGGLFGGMGGNALAAAPLAGLLLPLVGPAMSLSSVLPQVGKAIEAVGGGSGLASRPVKDFIGNLQGFQNEWKRTDFPAMGSQVKTWGDQAGGEFQKVGQKKDQLLQNFSLLQQRFPIPFVVEWGESAAEAIRSKIQGLIDFASQPFALNITAILHGFDELMHMGGPVWEMTHDRALNIMALLHGASELLAEPGPIWELTHDRSLTIVPVMEQQAEALLRAKIAELSRPITPGRTLALADVPVGSDTLTNPIGSRGQLAPGVSAGMGRVYTEAEAVAAELGVDPRIIATIASTESNLNLPGGFTLGITTAASRGGKGASGGSFASSNNYGGTQPSAFWAYQNGAEAAQAFKDYITQYQPALAPLLGDASKFFDPNGPISTSNYFVPTAGESANAGGKAAATANYYSNWRQRALGLTVGSTIGGGGGPLDLRFPNQGVGVMPDGTIVGPGIGVSAGGGLGGGGGGFDPDKAKQKWMDFIQKLAAGEVTIRDIANSFEASDPVLKRFEFDISQGMNPVDALNDGLQALGQTSIDMLSDALPTSAENTLAAFGQLQQNRALDAVNALVLKLGTTTVEQFGSAMPGAADVSGQSLTMLQAVAQRLKASGLDPAHVSVGDLTNVLGALGADIPGLNDVIQGLINKLNAIPRDIQVSVSTLGVSAGSGGSGGGGRISTTQGGNGGQANIPGATSQGGFGTTRTNNGGVGGMGQFASGGWPPVGLASLVGENGPELFVPSVPGQIFPNDDLRGLGGGGMTVIVQVNGIMDLTNPSTVNRLADTVGNAVMRNIRTRTGLGRV